MVNWGQIPIISVRGGSDWAQTAWQRLPWARLCRAPPRSADGLGWRDQDRLPELFVDALVKMKPGDISEPLLYAVVLALLLGQINLMRYFVVAPIERALRKPIIF